MSWIDDDKFILDLLYTTRVCPKDQLIDNDLSPFKKSSNKEINEIVKKDSISTRDSFRSVSVTSVHLFSISNVRDRRLQKEYPLYSYLKQGQK